MNTAVIDKHIPQVDPELTSGSEAQQTHLVTLIKFGDKCNNRKNKLFQIGRTLMRDWVQNDSCQTDFVEWVKAGIQGYYDEAMKALSIPKSFGTPDEFSDLFFGGECPKTLHAAAKKFALLGTSDKDFTKQFGQRRESISSKPEDIAAECVRKD